MADYILGHLPEADEARLEAEYFVDPRLQEQLLMIEDEPVVFVRTCVLILGTVHNRFC